MNKSTFQVTGRVLEREEIEKGHVLFKRSLGSETRADRNIIQIPFLSNLFTSEGNLSIFGIKFINDFEFVSHDIYFYFTYFNQESEMNPQCFADIGDILLNPLFVFFFIKELSTSVQIIPKKMNSERRILSDLIRQIIINSQTLVLFETIGTFYDEILNMLQKQHPSSLIMYNDIIRNCIFNAAKFNGIKCKVKFEDNINIFEFNSYCHKCASAFNKNWIYRPENEKNLVETAQLHMMMLSQKASEKFGKKFIGNLKIHFNFEYNRLFKANLTCELVYGNEKTSYKSVDFIIPVVASEPTIKVNVYNNDKYISTIQITDLNQSKSETMICNLGSLEVTKEFHSNRSYIQLPYDEIPKADEIMEVFNSLIDEFIERWFESGLDFFPPSSSYMKIVNYAMLYAIPSPIFYITIANKLINGWNNSGAFLTVLSSIFLISFVTLHKCQSTCEEKQMFSDLQNKLIKLHSDAIILHLSKPGMCETYPIVPMLILHSFLVGQEKFKSGLDTMKTIAARQIVNSIVAYLPPVYCDDPPEAIEKLKLFLPEGNYSHVTFKHSSIIEACEQLIKRTQEIVNFYEEQSLPLFLDMALLIQKKLTEFAVVLRKVFFKLKPLPEGPDVIKFVKAYRKFFSIYNQDVPFSQFIDYIHLCIDQIGYNMMNWVEKAIQLDNFEIDDRINYVSTSISDLFVFFVQSYAFVTNLNWTDSSIHPIVQHYLDICVTASNYYFDILMKKILLFYPQSIAGRYINAQININPATVEQIIIILHNFLAFKRLWTGFTGSFNSFGYDIPQNIRDFTSDTYQRLKLIEQIQATQIAREVKSKIKPNLWSKKETRIVTNSINYHIIKKRFEDNKQDLIDHIAESLKPRIALFYTSKSVIISRKLIQSILVGLDKGLMRCLISKSNYMMMKKEYFTSIIDMFYSIRQSIFDYIVEIDPHYDYNYFEEQLVSTTYLLKIYKMKPEDIIQLKDESVEFRFIQFLVVSMYAKENKSLPKYTKSNIKHFKKLQFHIRIFNPRLKASSCPSTPRSPNIIEINANK